MYDIKIEDEELMRALTELGAEGRSIVSDAIMETLMAIEAAAKNYAPVDTGRLRASITSKLEDWNRGVVGTNVEYAPFQEYGTRPHIIYPKKARMLRWESDGQVHFARRVLHPGFKGKFYMRRAMEENKDGLLDALIRRIRAIL